MENEPDEQIEPDLLDLLYRSVKVPPQRETESAFGSRPEEDE